MTKILITDSFTITNIGSAAVLENVIKHLKRYIPEASFLISTTDPSSIEKFMDEKSVPELFIRPLVLGSNIKRLKWLFKNIFWIMFNSLNLILKRIGVPYKYKLYTFSKERKKVIEAYVNNDVVISIGAERINDNFRAQVPFALYGYWMAKMLNKPVILYAQTIGPFRHKSTKMMVKYILNRCDLITVRDRRSLDELKELNIKKATIYPVADPAILQHAVSEKKAAELISEEGFETTKPNVIGISVLKWNYENVQTKDKTKDDYYNDYVLSLSKLSDFLIDNLNAAIVFVATNFRQHGNRDDDRDVAEDIINLMKFKDSAKVLKRIYRPDELKGIIGLMDMFIASRMHACIFSTAMYVPTISLNYQFKLYEYMKLLKMGDKSCNFEDINYEKLKTLALSVWESRPEIRNQLKIRIDELSKESLKSAELVKELIDKI